jgi:hypothetical protein
MSSQENEFLRVIKLLNDNDCLKDVILIGSWAEFLYQQTSLIPVGTTALRTLDVDFLIANIRKPNPPINLEELAEQQGYAVDKHFLLGTTKIQTPSRLELEFLIAQRGAGKEPTYKTALGVTAQALRNLELLRDNTMPISYFDINIMVPIPEAYVLHKIIINNERSKSKMEKDRRGILSLFPHINKDVYDALMQNCTKKEIRKIETFWSENVSQKI